MTNPGNAVGTNAAYNSRTSVEAFNNILQVFEGAGLVSGWATEPSSGLTLAIGGDGSTPDVAIAQKPTGDRTFINNISRLPIEVALSAAPTVGSRIDSIIAYVTVPTEVPTDLPSGTSIIDAPQVCGIIAVEGTVANSPVAPDETAIYTAIVADGGTNQDYYVKIADIAVGEGATDITAPDITPGETVSAGGGGGTNVWYTDDPEATPPADLGKIGDLWGIVEEGSNYGNV